MACKATAHLNLSADQVQLLEDNFKKISKHPSGLTLMLIAAECRLTEEETQEWFKLRNAQWREAEGLPAEEKSVLD